MSYLEAQERMRRMVAFDLTRDFNNEQISPVGELEMWRFFRSPIIIALGSEALLGMERVSMVDPNEWRDTDDASNLYVIRNLSGAGEAVVLDDGRRATGTLTVGGRDAWTVLGRQSLVVGTALDATPELELPDSVSPHHMQIRIGAIAGHIHFMDLYTAGTTVYVDTSETDTTSIKRQRRTWDGPGFRRTVEGVNQRWSRDNLGI